MLRLTLRSREDGRFLARVIERDGFAFVLDYGDPSTVADASERVARGFSVYFEGSIRNIPPTSKQLLPRLADYYEQEGLLVNLEEQNVASMVPQQSPFAKTGSPVPLHASLPSHPVTLNDYDDETELVPIDVPIGEQVTVIRKRPDLEEDTMKIELPVQPRRMWSPPAEARTLTDFLEPVAVVPPSEEWVSGDEEETELVPLEMRRRVIRGEDLTENHSDVEATKPNLTEE